jgi:hypothetical protein
MNGHEKVAQMLIDSGADINIEKVTTSLSFLLLLSLF